MENKSEPNTIEEILSSHEVPKLSFTGTEQAIIAREQRSRVGGLFKSEFDAVSIRILKPWLELSTAAHQAGPDSLSGKTMEEIRRGAIPRTIDHADLRVPPISGLLRDGILRSSHCSTITLEPPYTAGGPLVSAVGGPLVEQVGDAVIKRDGPLDPAVWKTTSSLALPAEGILSLGVGNGNFLGSIYPSRDGWLFGDANSATAELFYIAVNPKGSCPNLTSAQVTIDVSIQNPILGGHALLLPGGANSTGHGLVGLFGKMYLTLHGAKSLGGPRTSSKTFLLSWTPGSGVGEWEPNFSLSETIGLGPGAGLIAISIAVKLQAFRAGVDDPSGGFSGIDCLIDTIPTASVVPFRGPGPIKIQTIGMTFCSDDFIPADVLK